MASHSNGCFSGLRTLVGRKKTRGTVTEKSSSGPTFRETSMPIDYSSALGYCCDFSFDPSKDISSPPPYSSAGLYISKDKALQTIDNTLDDISPSLRDLSLKIHGHPEMKWEEVYAHDTLSKFMEDRGFKVTRQYLGLKTAWRAEFSYGKYKRVIGVNSEMDALPSGHACGHNLIAAGGVGIALALKAALETHRIPGKIILLGTPAEEGGGGKIDLIERGGYEEMDACVMIHPSAGPQNYVALGSTTAIMPIEVEYFGHSAHAAAAPWEGTNALDAAFIAYSSVSALRQQMKPDHRVHGIVVGKDWRQNVIPDYAKLVYGVRAPTRKELLAFAEKVQNCLKAGALATSCEVKITLGRAYDELQQNSVLGDTFASVLHSRYGFSTSPQGTSASTDFGNVSYALPSLHPGFTIPAEAGNHTPEFVKAAATPEAHEAMITTIKGLSATALRFIEDDAFAKEVKHAFEITCNSNLAME